jgi:uncharacterized protein (DUF2141 family)
MLRIFETSLINKLKQNIMKSLILKLVIVLIASFTYAQNTGQNITVTIDNVTSDEGKVLFALHTKDTFMKGEGIDTAQSTIENGKVSVTFKNVQAGEYAIVALHDANDNGRMDFQENGMPLEAYGTSNNPMFFGPPQYDEAKFEVATTDLEMKIRF